MDYPAKVTVDTPAKVANWRVLVHWLLVIPHQIILTILSVIQGAILWYIMWLVAIFTGKIPGGLARYAVMVSRYNFRVKAYSMVLSDVYPPFQWNGDDTDPGDYPTSTEINVQLAGHNRMTVLFRPILMIPALIFFLVIQIILAVVDVIMFFVLLFTGRWPAGLHRFVVGAFNVEVRFSAYANFLTDSYPPFKLNLDTPASMPSSMTDA